MTDRDMDVVLQGLRYELQGYQSSPIYDRLAEEYSTSKSVKAAEDEFFEYANAFPNMPFDVAYEEFKKLASSLVHNLYMVLSRNQEAVVNKYGTKDQKVFNAGYISAIDALVTIYGNAGVNNG